MPKGSDNNLGIFLRLLVWVSNPCAVGKYIKHFDKNDRFLRAKNDDSIFSIEHYAGRVEYHADSFLEKNKDR